jgi:hypothetical protein
MTEPTQVERTSNRPLVIVVILGALFFAWITWRVSTGDRAPSSAAMECRARYDRAGSFADTARVDATYPTNYAQERGRNRGPATCGELRQEQLLR